LGSRFEIYIEQYVKHVLIETKLVRNMAKTMIIPAALRYQRELAQGQAALSAAGITPSTKLLEQVTGLIGDLDKGLAELETAIGHHAKGAFEEAKHLKQKALPAMMAVRTAADALEGLVAYDLWPLPTYLKMLFPG
jgi:glutamine synthetase